MNQNFINGLPTTINGDRVVQITQSKKVKMGSYVDLPSLFSWYQENPMENHLGLIDLFSNTVQVRVPMYRELFKNKQIIEVNGVNGRLTYDLPVTKHNGVYTQEDTSTYTDYPGIEGSVFPIVLDTAYTKGDVLTMDRQYGEQVVVSEDYEVEFVGENFKHWVTILSNDKSKYYDKDQLKAGIQYFKIGHLMGEYSVDYSGIENPNIIGTITCEMELGNHRGVETSWTMYADKKSFGALEVKAQQFYQEYLKSQENMAGDMFVMGNLATGSSPTAPKISAKGAFVGSTLEFLGIAEYMRLEANQLLFQKGAVVQGTSGTKKANEGLWHQWRRGRLIKYAKAGGITENHIREASNYLFQSRPDMRIYDRKMKFKCGSQAYNNMLVIFEKWVIAQTTGLALFNGADRLFPKSPISGGSLTDLALSPVVFTQVPIPGIGLVEIEHDPSLDFQEGADRFAKGFNDFGFADTTYSMVIYDATDAQYSNARTTLPQGTTLIEGGKKGSVYFVKPEGDNMYWGYENGRYAGEKASDIVSSMKTMSRSFWVHGMSAVLNVDPSATIIIEIKR